MSKKLSDVIGYDYRADQFVIGSHDLAGKANPDYDKNKVEGSAYGPADVDAMLAQLAVGGANLRDSHELLAQTIVEPIEKVVPYVEMFFPTFFVEQNYGPTEDNKIPVEDIVTLAFETSDDGAIMYTRAGFTWTRPTFIRWDVGIEVNWFDLEKAGWNLLARQMRYATYDLARKRDRIGRALIEASLQPASVFNITGGKLTKTAVDALLKYQASIGFPMQRVLLNPGTLMDMAGFNWAAPNTGTGPNGFFTPPEMARELVQTLHIMNYGGAEWYTNVNASTTEVYFGTAPAQIGWHQTRGEMRRASDIDITNKRDIHAIIDQEHAGYVGNVYGLAKIGIGA